MRNPVQIRPWTVEEKNALRALVDQYYAYQDERLALDGRLGITKSGNEKKGASVVSPEWAALMFQRHDELAGSDGRSGLEAQYEKQIAERVKHTALWEKWLKDVKGCGPVMAAVILVSFDINIATTVSKLWQFSGNNPGMVRGKKRKGDEIIVSDELVRGDRKTPGFVAPFNGWLRTKLNGVLAGSFIKAQAPYALDYYYPYKHRLESMDWGNASKNPTDKKRPKAGHQDKAAKRYMIKMFLRDLYVQWRTIEGLPVRAPYQEEYLGHKHGVA